MNFNYEKTKELDELIKEYFIKTGNTPFLDIDVNEDITYINIDMVEDFRIEAEELLKEDFDVIFSDYFNNFLIEVAQKDLKNEEVEEN